jgi:hypothetical protein
VQESSLAEQLTINFYEWEQRGRGWQVWECPVDLEPPFEPFGFHVAYFPIAIVDDGRKPTFLSSLVDQFKGVFKRLTEKPSTFPQEEPAAEIAPLPFSDDSEVRELIVTLPAKNEVAYDYAEYLLLSLSSCSAPVGFEILGTNEKIIIQFACRESDIPHVKQCIRSFFPEAIVSGGQSLSSFLDRREQHTVIVDCGLSDEFMRPLQVQKDFDPDPLTTIFGTLENLQPDDVGFIQVLFHGAQSPWASSILRSVRDQTGGSFFVDAPEMVKLAEEKVSMPLFSVVLRLVGQSASNEKAWNVVRSLYAGLKTFANPMSNELIPLTNDDYDDTMHLEDIIRRESHRSGMLLNTRELLGIVHFPSPTLSSEKLKRTARKTNALPKIAIGYPFILGENVHREIKTEGSLSAELRIRHVHIIGKTGTGKSTLLVSMIKQDIEAGRGVAVLDPHGDLIERIVERIPENRVKDVILFDPSDTEYPVGFNILEAHSDMEQTVLSSDLVELFRRFSTSWGDQMSTVLSNAIAAIIESKQGGTLLELKRFLLEKDIRKSILNQNGDPSIVYFWEREFPLLKGGSQVSIITRLDAFLRSKIIRNIITQNGGLDFGNIIESGKIFLAKLSQGIIGEGNAHLLGSLICSKLHQVVMGRQALDVKERRPFFLYLDEFQHFATPSMASMLSGSRKFSFGLTLVHQDLQQIADSALTNSVITNPATRICFALGDNDAQKLQSGFAHFDANDLMNLSVGETIVSVERNESDFNLTTYDILSVPQDIASLRRDQIVVHTREMYGRKVTPVEITTPQAEKKGAPTTAAKVRTEPAIVIERRAETQPKLATTPVKPLVSIPTEDLESRKNISQHRYLQTLIKKMAEQRGYRAVIEEPTPDGLGRVDIGLEREGKRIACEISVTTGDVQELHNIEKCLRAGYDPVIVCSQEKKNLDAIRKAVVDQLSSEEQSKVLFFEPNKLFLFLDEQTVKEVSKEERVKGYRVKVQYSAVSDVEKKRKREAITDVVVQSLKRIKG